MQTNTIGCSPGTRARSAAACAVLALLGAACLSSGPPAPPVRWFDPLADRVATAAVAAAVHVRVEAAPHLRSEFAVRVGEHEVAFDDDHRWLEPPAELLAQALRRVGVAATRPRPVAVVQLERFEFDRTGEPRARVRLVVRPVADGAGDGVVDVSAAAADGSPTALVVAMATALSQAAERVSALLVADGD